MARRIPDAVVIGSGPNGLVAANLLVDAGWDVLVLEQQPQPGGAVASASDVADGFVHDTFSSFYPLAAVSPVITSLSLENFGLTWSHAPAVVGTPAAGGGWALLYRDVERTAAALDRLWPGDGDAWRELSAGWDTLGPALIRALLTPFPPLRGVARTALAAPKSGVRPLTNLIRSARSLSADLHSDAAQMLIVGNAAHADLSPDGAGSALIGWLLAMLGQTVGFPVPRGGAGRLATALAARFTAAGGEIRCYTTVSAIEVEHGRAVGVRAGQQLIRCRRAVIADVSAPALYGELLDPAVVPARVHRRLRQFEWDPGTVKVDWALSGPVPWSDPPADAPGTVHLGASVTEVSVWMAQVTGQVVPADPFLLVGQMTAADPSRSPAGTEALWAYTHVPQHVRSDERGKISGRWDAGEVQEMADRMQARIERHAPDLASRIIARRVLGPRELEQRNANLHGGALGGGTSALHQQLVLRPIPGLGRAETCVRGVFLGSSSAHPGAGVHGAAGANAARAAILHARWGRLRPT